MTACTDDERRRVAAALREYSSFDCEDEGEEECLVDCADWGERVLNLLGCGDTEGECYTALADLIEPSCDPTERGIDSIYDWCFAAIEGADGPEDELYCTIMRAIEEYRHPERITARTARPVDRDALLALAEGLEFRADKLIRDAQHARFSELGPTMDRAKHDASELRVIARRIREACGEVS